MGSVFFLSGFCTWALVLGGGVVVFVLVGGWGLGCFLGVLFFFLIVLLWVVGIRGKIIYPFYPFPCCLFFFFPLVS